jgi:hypothetical protein
MIPLLQLFTMKSTSDGHYKQCAVTEFPVAVTKEVANIHNWLCNVYGNAAVDRSNVHRWVKKMRDGKVGTVQLLDVLHQLEG